MDRISPDSRSALMSRIRSKDTAPELIVRRLLHGLGYRYVLHDRRLPGKPDLVFPSRKKIVLINGCFWHGHACPRGFRPTSNAAFWAKKIDGNRRRDRRTRRALRALGWDVLVVWECHTRPTRLGRLRRRLESFLAR
jgi:DNA mismatch endonuclease, patch repair protein